MRFIGLMGCIERIGIDDCALNLWRIQIAPNPQACPRYHRFPKVAWSRPRHCEAHFERLVDANKIIIQENAAVPSQNFIRSRNLGSLPTQMRARNKIEI